MYFNFLCGALFFPNCTLKQHEETFFCVCALFFCPATRNKLTKKKRFDVPFSFSVPHFPLSCAFLFFFLLSQWFNMMT